MFISIFISRWIFIVIIHRVNRTFLIDVQLIDVAYEAAAHIYVYQTKTVADVDARLD